MIKFSEEDCKEIVKGLYGNLGTYSQCRINSLRPPRNADREGIKLSQEACDFYANKTKETQVLIARFEDVEL